MIRYYSEEDVRQAFPMARAIGISRDVFRAFSRGEAKNQPRRRLTLEGGTTLHSMAGAYRRYLGTKVYTTNPKHGAHFTFLLYDAATAEPLAQFEANHLGQIRTGAASGLAADLLTGREASTLGIIGSGFQARTQLEAVMAVRKLERVRVWSRSEEKREKFADAARRELGAPAEAASSAAEAMDGAAMVVTATYAREPVIEAAEVPKAALVIAMGSNYPDRRELPGELVRAARVVVDSVEQARIEAGDLLLALDEDGWGRVEEIGAADETAGLGDRLTVFKSVGLGVQDVAAAAWIYERATPGQSSADPNRATR